MRSLTLKPIKRLAGDVTLPGSKSLSNRALLLSALAKGRTRLNNLLNSDDIERMVDALQQLSIELDFLDNRQTCTVTGNNGLFDCPENTEFFLGNAGTAIRPLTAALSLVDGDFIIDGDKYMRERPIAHLTELSRNLSRYHFSYERGYPPFQIQGGKVKGGNITLNGNISSQYLTSLLMALPLAITDSNVRIIGDQVSKPYLDITLRMMQLFGVRASHENYQSFQIPGKQCYRTPGDYMIEGDASSASYFFAGAAIAGGKIAVHGIGTNSVQGDIQFLDAIEAMGASVARHPNSIEVESKGRLKGVDLDLNHIPDAAMTPAQFLFLLKVEQLSGISITGVKETDRMHAMAEGLTRLGRSDITSDSITIDPPAQIQQAIINPYGDHRVAMAFSLAALSDAKITIKDPDCTRKTFPDFFQVLDSVSVY